MKITGHHLIIALMALVIAVLSWTLIYVSRDQLRLHDEEYEEEIEIESTATVQAGRAIVRVDSQSQAASGIRTRALQATQYESGLEVYGRVADIEPLLDLRGRYLAAIGEGEAFRAAAATARADFQLARALYEDQRNISQQAFREAESRLRVADARLDAARSTLSVLRDSLRTAWGPVVSEWAMTAQSAQLDALLARQSALVQLVFPYEIAPGAPAQQLMLAPVSARANLVAAQFVSDAPRANPALPGNTYFYLASGSFLRAGARVVARLATGEASLDGVVVPNEAVVWHAGKSWVYRKQGAETFGRHEISTANEIAGGWFQHVTDEGEAAHSAAMERAALSAGDEVVISGAQLLLSEELKFQIRNENED